MERIIDRVVYKSGIPLTEDTFCYHSLGDTSRNLYIPYYVVNSIDTRIGEDYSLYRRFNEYSDLFSEVNIKYDKLLWNIRSVSVCRNKYVFKKNGVFTRILSGLGFLMDCTNGGFLFILCTKDIMNKDTNALNSNPELFRLYINTDFVRNPLYSYVYKKVKEGFFNLCEEAGIDFLYTTKEKIEEEVFGNYFKIPGDLNLVVNNLRNQEFVNSLWELK